jgi:glycosyltransferase involved in cell wall biosynthesis
VNYPKISIVTPSFNQAAYVRETLESVLNQGYPNLEYIVIDGGSTDGAVDIIKEYQSKLAYFVSEPDTGHGNALNKGFSRSTGDIMAWINSDDKYTPWTFKTVVQIFEQHPEVEWIVGFQGSWSNVGTLLEGVASYKNIHDYLRNDFAWIQQESVFWRRSLWEKAGGFINENYRFMVDGELWTRFFVHAPLYHAHCIISGYRVTGQNRAMKNMQACLDEMQQAIDQMRLGDIGAATSREDIYPVLVYNNDDSLWVSVEGRRSVNEAAQGT